MAPASAVCPVEAGTFNLNAVVVFLCSQKCRLNYLPGNVHDLHWTSSWYPVPPDTYEKPRALVRVVNRSAPRYRAY